MKDDSTLQANVLGELKWEPSVTAAHIGVTAEDGVVTLSGHVPSFAEKYAAEKAAKRVYGCKAVANELEVKLPDESQREDDAIAAACLRALEASHVVPEDRIQVVVTHGWVKLDGEVEWQYQKKAAENAVRYLTGVVSVANNIQVKPQAAPADVRSMIEAAFRRNAEIDARRVSVEAHEGAIILRGNVRSWAERNAAQRAAWAAPGVISVTNEISVVP
ncbi:BON domain-containing protein [Candidatus Laterigemmans baculatus]|uniref:BON domain-containing protein n=1 Tax=Candidatus Laterigemmans baculatus TaxID=2770505 RepID=UPI0013DA94F7|nr:BON domain-containing protein [Candidatus Laterigemmans baculatus]